MLGLNIITKPGILVFSHSFTGNYPMEIDLDVDLQASITSAVLNALRETHGESVTAIRHRENMLLLYEGVLTYGILFTMEDDPELLAAVHHQLQDAKLRCQVIYSHGQFLDILPYRASKGRAIKYLKYKWNIAPENVMVAGDSGNDVDMLRGRTCGLVVSNHSKELEKLKGQKRIFFSDKEYAGGIIDGLIYYKFL